MSKPLIAVTLGDPAGIGPEIVAKSIADKELFKEANCIVVGERQIMENAVKITGEDLKVKVVEDPADGGIVGKTSTLLRTSQLEKA